MTTATQATPAYTPTQGLPTPMSAYSATPLSSTNNLMSSTITPGAGTDRYGIAQQQLSNYNQATDPLYQQSLREATSQAAGAGQLGSGQLRTSIGDLANARQNDLQTQGNTFLTNALNGSIQDAYNNIGIAQQQQGYQSGLQNQTYNQGLAGAQLQNATQNQQFTQGLQNQQQQAALQNQSFNQGVTGTQLGAQLQNQQYNQGLSSAQLQNSLQGQLFGEGLSQAQLNNQTQAQQFGQGVTSSQLQDQLTNSAYGRALSSYNAGNLNDPSGTELGLSQIYGGQASQANSALSGLIGNTVNNNAQQSSTQSILQALGIGGPSGIPSTSTSNGSSPLYGNLGNLGSYVGNGVTY